MLEDYFKPRKSKEEIIAEFIGAIIGHLIVVPLFGGLILYLLDKLIAWAFNSHSTLTFWQSVVIFFAINIVLTLIRKKNK